MYEDFVRVLGQLGGEWNLDRAQIVQRLSPQCNLPQIIVVKNGLLSEKKQLFGITDIIRTPLIQKETGHFFTLIGLLPLRENGTGVVTYDEQPQIPVVQPSAQNELIIFDTRPSGERVGSMYVEKLLRLGNVYLIPETVEKASKFNASFTT
ncbi:hypothetical protein C4579_02425 [Candidatus Microgenomates bacterium]|nr:MAG: hypothetical protein C4579_02425 [Candidatus Microgenomates bacterium]